MITETSLRTFSVGPVGDEHIGLVALAAGRVGRARLFGLAIEKHTLWPFGVAA